MCGDRHQDSEEGRPRSDCTEPECLQNFHTDMSTRGPERPPPKFGWEVRAGTENRGGRAEYGGGSSEPRKGPQAAAEHRLGSGSRKCNPAAQMKGTKLQTRKSEHTCVEMLCCDELRQEMSRFPVRFEGPGLLISIN